MHRVLRRSLAVLFALAACTFSIGADGEKKEEPKFKLSQEEEEILKLTNQAREKEKLPALKLSPLLTKVARAHSANMAKKEELAHELDGKDAQQRIKDSGYSALWGGENIAVTNGDKPAGIFRDWMNSQHHRENILRDKYTEIGIGMAKNAKGEIYYTQVFAKPRAKR
jgi:uncharacterized protein YkwD